MSKRTHDKTDNWFDKDPRPEEFKKFHRLLTENAPEGYKPHYFKCGRQSKAPATTGSWKDESARLTVEEAVSLLGQGFNIGVAGMPDDNLVNMDIDGGRAPHIDNTPDTLKVRSRSREPGTGHGFFFSTDDVPNIPTGDSGEVRAQGQYVIAPGSYVPPDSVVDLDDDESLEDRFPDGVYEADVPDDQFDDAGYYTVYEKRPAATLQFRELPTVFIEHHAWTKHGERKRNRHDPDDSFEPSGDSVGASDSKLFDIKVRDIVPTEGGSTNPSERWSAIFHGSSTDANMSVSNKGRLQCWRHSVAHGALQILAVLSKETKRGDGACLSIGKGHKNSGAGGCQLRGGELVWPAWKYAKRKGYVPSCDPIPHSALVHVAKTNGIVESDQIEDGWKLPPKAYNAALDVVSEEHDLNPGRTYATLPEDYDGEERFLAALLPDPDELIDPHTPETPIPKNAVYDRVYRAIDNAIKNERSTLIDGIMSSGKTYNSFAVPADRGFPMSYFTSRIDLYDQAKQYALDCGIPEDEILVLPAIKRDCPTWQGEYGDEWAHRIQQQYYAGAQPKKIHTLNDDIPCREHGDSAKCPYELLWDFDPEDYQVIIGHYKHSHIVPVTAGRVCVFDEDPANAFQQGIYGEDLIESVNTFLSFAESPPAEDFDDLLQARHDPERVDDIVAWYDRDEWSWTPDDRNVIRLIEDQPYHAYAPFAVYTIALAEPIADGSDFERAPLPGDHNDGLFFTTSDERGQYYVEFQESPTLTYARTVLALDGTPLIDAEKNDPHKPREWTTSLSHNLYHARILSDEERAQYVSETLNHTYVQTSQYRKPYSSGRYNRHREDGGLLKAITEEYGNGQPPVALTSKTVADEYEDRGFVDAGIVEKFDHAGNLRGTNKYADTRLGVQLGSHHHGDHEIRRRSAWLRETVDPQGKGNDRDYGSDIGNAIHEQMADNQVLQNVMRFGRDGDGALIFLHTSAFPDWLPIHGRGEITPWSDGLCQVHQAFSDFHTPGGEGVERGEIADHDAVSVESRQVLNALKRFEELGLVEKHPHPRDGRKHVWVDDGLAAVDEHERAEYELADVDFEVVADDGEVVRDDTEILPISIYTANFVKYAPAAGGDGGSDDPPGDGDGDDPNEGGPPPSE